MKHHMEENKARESQEYKMITWDQRDWERERIDDWSSEVDRLSHVKEETQ